MVGFILSSFGLSSVQVAVVESSNAIVSPGAENVTDWVQEVSCVVPSFCMLSTS